MRLAITLMLILAAAAAFTLTAQQKTQPPLHVVTYVDVYPNFAGEAAALLSQMAAETRKEPGSIRYDVLRDTSRPNHFAIVEVWQTRQAFDAHTIAPHTRSLREKLQPNLGSPYDERLYNPVP
jgi:quinol monooxygenase YgiN